MNTQDTPQFVIKMATRQAFCPLIVLYSESGCGKTLSALYLARGIAGPSGKVVMGDSESGRGKIYADIVPGGYEHFDIEPPFSPSRYIAAVDAMEASGAAVGVLDSGSHEWEGLGGVCNMADANETESKRAGLHNWRGPKVEHALFIQRILRAKIPLIICLRAKYKTRQIKGTEAMAEAGAIQRHQIGKTIIQKDEYTSPIQAEDFIFEATCHMEVLPKHNINLTKGGHPSLAKCFPAIDGGPLTIAHGEQIAQWCANAGGPVKEDTTALKKELWGILEPVRGKEKNWKVAQQWMIDEMALDPEKTVNDLTAGEFRAAILSVTKKLKERSANVTA